MKNPVWLEEEVVLYFHSEQIKAHGGMAGLKLLGQPLRDALTRPQQLNVRFFPKQAFQSRTASSGIGQEQPLEQLQ